MTGKGVSDPNPPLGVLVSSVTLADDFGRVLLFMALMLLLLLLLVLMVLL